MTTDKKPLIIAEHLGQDGWHISYLHSDGAYTYPAEQRLELCHKHELDAANAEIDQLKEKLRVARLALSTWVTYEEEQIVRDGPYIKSQIPGFIVAAKQALAQIDGDKGDGK